MLAVFVTLQFGSEFNAQRVRELAHESQAMFRGVRGLRSKAFTLQAEHRRAVNVYVWEDPAAARAFFGAELRGRIAAAYGVEPVIEFAELAVLLDNWAAEDTREVQQLR